MLAKVECNDASLWVRQQHEANRVACIEADFKNSGWLSASTIRPKRSGEGNEVLLLGLHTALELPGVPRVQHITLARLPTELNEPPQFSPEAGALPQDGLQEALLQGRSSWPARGGL